MEDNVIEIVDLILESDNEFTKKVNSAGFREVSKQFKSLRDKNTAFIMLMSFLEEVKNKAISNLRTLDAGNTTDMITMQAYSFYPDIMQRLLDSMTREEPEGIGTPEDPGPMI